MKIITCIRCFKKSGEFVITEKDPVTGRYSKTHTNHLTAREIEWANSTKHRFQDDICVCWTN